MRRKNNSNINSNSSSNLSPDEFAFNIRVCLAGVQDCISKAKKNYEETGNLEALEVAFHGTVALSDMLKQAVQAGYGRHSYGEFELTK